MSEWAIRAIGNALWAIATVGFLLAGLSLLNILPQGLWRPLAGGAAAVSLVLLILYWHPWYVVGTMLNMAILAFTALRMKVGGAAW